MNIQTLLDSPEKWTRGWYARDAEGTACIAEDHKAACWCLLGAIRVCYPDFEERIAVECQVRQHIGPFVDVWNDAPNRTFEDIRELVETLDI